MDASTKTAPVGAVKRTRLKSGERGGRESGGGVEREIESEKGAKWPYLEGLALKVDVEAHL